MARETLRQRVATLLQSNAELQGVPPLKVEDAAYAKILCGDVAINGEKCREPARPVSRKDIVSIAGSSDGTVVENVPGRWVSRAAGKLLGALEDFGLDVHGLVWIDAGCSTGGFTQVLLRLGAQAVHAVDVGYNVLDFGLRNNPRVLVHERTNIRTLRDADLVPPADAFVADLSFRSLRGICSHLLQLSALRIGVVLIKPQFEYAARGVSGSGVQRSDTLVEEEFTGVLDATVSRNVVAELCDSFAEEGVAVDRLTASRIKGRHGNQEFLALVRSVPNGTEAAVVLDTRGTNAKVCGQFFSTYQP